MLCLLHISVDYDHKFYKSETTELHQQSVQTKQDTLQTSSLYPVPCHCIKLQLQVKRESLRISQIFLVFWFLMCHCSPWPWRHVLLKWPYQSNNKHKRTSKYNILAKYTIWSIVCTTSCHSVIWSSRNVVIWSSGHPVILSCGHLPSCHPVTVSSWSSWSLYCFNFQHYY